MTEREVEPPQMSEEWNEFVKAHPLPPNPTSIDEYRALKRSREQHAQTFLADPAFKALTENVVVEERKISLPEVAGRDFTLRVYRPATATATATATSSSPNSDGGGGVRRLPVLLYFHGGFYVSGSSLAEDLGCRAIIARSNNDIVIASFEYRLIPSARWHTLFSDAEYAMKWLAGPGNAESIGGDVSKGFLVGGAEAGAHLAAICAVRAKRRYPNVRLTGQVLIVPHVLNWLDLKPDPKTLEEEEWRGKLNSHVENENAPVLSAALYEMLISALTVGIPEDEARDPENFPVWAAAKHPEIMKALPPAYLAMDECDPIRDQGFLYAELLQKAGVRTRTDYYKGLPNMFVQWPELKSTVAAGGQLAAGVAWLLGLELGLAEA